MVVENGMVMMTLEEYGKRCDKSETDKLKKLLFKVMQEKTNGDVRVTRQEFLDIYNIAMDYPDDGYSLQENYEHNVEVHWHGIYCDCGDGATAWNHIISQIESVIDEDGDC